MQIGRVGRAEPEQSNKLLELVTKLEELHGKDLDKRRKTFTEVGQRQQHRIMMELKRRKQRGLYGSLKHLVWMYPLSNLKMRPVCTMK